MKDHPDLGLKEGGLSELDLHSKECEMTDHPDLGLKSEWSMQGYI